MKSLRISCQLFLYHTIGNNCEVNMNCTFWDDNIIRIGDNALIAPNVQIYTAFHPTNANDRFGAPKDDGSFEFCKTQTAPVIIGNNVWIDGGAIIMPGVTIGNNVVIGAGSIVTKDIPDNVIAYGNPCRVVRENNSKFVEENMVKAFFIDFYGTVVHEDGEIIKEIAREIYDTGNAINKSEIGSYWWNIFQKSFLASYGNNFDTQRNLEYQSLLNTIRHFSSTADVNKMSNMMFEHWMNPPIFEESKEFFQICPVPIYIVSNIDRVDILKAIKVHDLKPAGVFTSEDAKSYKPRKELFELALKSTNLSGSEVIHIGDSLSSDVEGATSVGINAIWVNREKREVPNDIKAISNLLEIYDKDFL